MTVASPSLFPMPDDPSAAAADPRRITRRVVFRVAHHSVGFASTDPAIRFFVHESHDPFLGPAAERAQCELNWLVGDAAPSEGPPVRTASDRWELRLLASGGEEIVFRSDVGNRPTMRMRFAPDFSAAEVTQASRPGRETLVFASEYPWAEYIVTRLLGREGGLLLHASSCVRDGVAYLFMGHSGAGKSTISELAETAGARILSDDRTIITLEGGVPTAWGTPWHGSFARTSSGCAPVHSISLLVQDQEDRLAVIPAQRAFKETFVRLIQPRITAAEVDRTLATLEEVITRVPVNELHFRPTAAAFELAARG